MRQIFLNAALLVTICAVITLAIIVRAQNLYIARLSESLVTLSSSVHDISVKAR